jgi:hypothetical protein
MAFQVAVGDSQPTNGRTIYNRPDQLGVGHVEEAPFDRCAERSTEGQLLVAFRPRPEAPLQDDRRS